MKNTKQLGIWMDHSNAFLMELTKDTILDSNIVSEFNHEDKVFSLSKNENLMHNKEQHQQANYYQKLSEIIRSYHEVVLFGPTDAKDELSNVLKADQHFKDIKIEVRHTDKLTQNQMHAFVREYFSK